ncbi:MAG: hypothetical protein NT075_04240 [Chloroflexi bacterium]|nr:hypothetical protein [Chloroflexota bacterium]
MKNKSTKIKLSITHNQLIRIVAQDPPAAQVLAQARAQQIYPVQIRNLPEAPLDDYAQIDPTLQVEAPAPTAPVEAPRLSLGYAGLTPQQRYQFLAWLEDPLATAPLAFQQLYLAHLEVRLFEGPHQAQAAQKELQRLQYAPAWRHHELLARTLLLSYWLTQDGSGLASWLAEGLLPPSVLESAIGCQSLLHEELHAEQIVPLAEQWQLATNDAKPAVLALRLNSLTANLGAAPLAYALAQAGEDAQQPRPWRAVHRDLRIALPQPQLRVFLAPLLSEMLATAEQEPEEPIVVEPQEPDDQKPGMDDLGWHLILEFGHSRSDFFEFAVDLAQRMESYTQITDENRRLVHRVFFKKRELRQFWRLWDYVQSWSSTQIYLNGEDLPKWKIYPYSPYLK